MPKNITHKFQTRLYLEDKKIKYVDENDFTKKYKGLRRVLPKTFKYLCFEHFKTLYKHKEGFYQDELPTEDDFEAIYGKVIIQYSVINDMVIIEDLKPNDILLANYYGDLKIYKGIPYNTEKDKFKIEIYRRKENDNTRVR